MTIASAYRSTFPFICEWYARCLILKYPQIVAKSLLTKYQLLVDGTKFAMQNDMIKWSRKIFGTFVARVLEAGAALFNKKWLSIFTITCWFPYAVPEKHSRISLATNLIGPLDGNSCNGHLCLYLLPFLAELLHCATMSCTFLAVSRQQYFCLNKRPRLKKRW